MKFIDTRDNWKIRGYKLVPGSTPYGVDSRTKQDLYSWGQVVPLDYNLSILDQTKRNQKRCPVRM